MAEFKLTPPRDPGAMGALYGAPDANPQTAIPAWLASVMAPNITGLARGEPDPNQFSSMPLPESGKVPSTDDPRVAAALAEGAMLAGSLAPVGRTAMGTNAAARMIPEVMQAAPGVAMPSRAAPLLGAGAAAGGAALAGSPAEAAEQFQWSDPDGKRAAEIAALQKRINDRAEKITQLGGNKPNANSRNQGKAYDQQGKAIDQLSKLNAPDAPDVKRLDELSRAQSEDRTTALTSWRQTQQDARTAADEKKKAETSFFDMVPGVPSRAAIALASPAIAYKFGKFAGTKLPAAGAIPTAAVAGGLSGFGSVAGPTEVDINSLPRSSPTRQSAEADLDTKNYWLRTALASGFSAAMGAKGAIKGNLALRPDRAFPGAGSEPPPAMPQPMASPEMPIPPGAGTTPAIPLQAPPPQLGSPFMVPPDLSKAKAPRGAKTAASAVTAPPNSVPAVLTPSGWVDPLTGKLIAPPPMIRD